MLTTRQMLLALAPLAASAPAFADATLSSDLRSATSSARLNAPSGLVERIDSRAATDGSDLLANVRTGLGFGIESATAAVNVNAFQQSWLSGNDSSFEGFRMLGSVLIAPVLGATEENASLNATARSFLDLSFSLARPAPFNFSLSATLRPDQRFANLGSGGLAADLRNDNDQVFFSFASDLVGRSRPTTPRFDRDGFLPAGNYRFRLELWSQSAWPASVSGNLDSTFAVPAPSAFLGLLGLGLFATARKRK